FRWEIPDGRPFRTTAPYPPLEGAYLGLLGGGGYHVPPAPSPARLVSMALLQLLPTAWAGFASVDLRRPALRQAPTFCRSCRQPSLDFPLAARRPPATIRPTCLCGADIPTYRNYPHL